MGDYSDTIYKFVNSIMNVKDDLENFQESLSDFISENQILLQNILSGKEVMVSDFLGLCDERVYNMDSKQNDIKYMKRLDFAGLYYIKNITKKNVTWVELIMSIKRLKDTLKDMKIRKSLMTLMRIIYLWSVS